MLVTNGSRLTPSYREIIPFLDWVSLSIDAADPEQMRKLWGVET